MLLQKYYDLLEIPMFATEMQIKKAYRRKAKLLHPDANSNANAKLQFQILNEAYHFILKNLHQSTSTDTSDTFKNNYKKYGTSVRNKSYSSDKNTQFKNPDFLKKEEPLNRAPYDKYIYWFFLALGINMLVYALLDVFVPKGGEEPNYYGLFAAIPFLTLLIIGWRLMKKV